MIEDQPCSFPGCKVISNQLLTEITTATKIYTLCPLHLPYYLDNKTRFILKGDPTRYREFKCYLCECEDDTVQFQVNEHNRTIDFSICPTHLTRLLYKKLSPSEYFLLKERFGEFFEISDEFYHNGGISKNL